MKKIVIVFAILMISSVLSASDFKNEMETTFIGVSKSGAYIFEDEDGVLYYFQEMKSDVDFNLEDEKYIGALFKVNYEYYYVTLYDDEGEDTGESEEFLRILILKLL